MNIFFVDLKIYDTFITKIILLYTYSITLSITSYIMLTTEVNKGHYFSNEVKDIKKLRKNRKHPIIIYIGFLKNLTTEVIFPKNLKALREGRPCPCWFDFKWSEIRARGDLLFCKSFLKANVNRNIVFSKFYNFLISLTLFEK